METGGRIRGNDGLKRALIAVTSLVLLALGPASIAAPVTQPDPPPSTDAADPLSFGESEPGGAPVGIAAAEVLAVTALPTDFVAETIWSGLNFPTFIRFASDGRVFVSEKRGTVLAFDSLTDQTPKTVLDFSAATYAYWDRGLLGMTIHPNFPAQPYLYVLYTTDILGYGDTCPSPPGGTTDGCMANAQLSRIQVNATNDMVGAEQVLITGAWCQQYPSHSIGQLEFGADGALYVSAGDGASFNFADYGQGGGGPGSPTDRNPCGDPPVPVGGVQSPPLAQGGALRSQDLRTPETPLDPVTLDGAILRINESTGAAFAGNPLLGGDTGDDRIIAHGLRNPFRLTVRPGTSDIWIGDVGWNLWEEINRIPSLTPGVATNFGWPCYEGMGRNASYDGANLNICENLYTSGSHTAPYYTYQHGGTPLAGCPGTSSSISGLAFYEGGPYPAQYDGALFFSDFTRSCIWVMFPGGNGLPSPSNITLFASQAPAVGLEIGPNGDLFSIDHLGGSILRYRYTVATNQSPTAVASAVPTSGPAPLLVDFDGSGSSDPEDDPLTYAWDLDGDGLFDDSTVVDPSFTYDSAGTRVVGLSVSDGNSTDSDTVTIAVTGGGGGGDGFVDLPGLSGHNITTPDRALLDITGDIDIRADVALDDWQTNMAKIVSKFGSAYEFMLNGTTGQLRLAWRNPANTALLRNSTVAVPAADGQRLQIRATLDVNNGAGGHTVTFYYRTDTTQALTNNTGWTQLGTPIVTTGTTSIRADATVLTLGSRPGGTAHFWPGNLYQALILNGINGTIAANPDFRTTTQLTSTPPNYTQWQDTAQNPGPSTAPTPPTTPGDVERG